MKGELEKLIEELKKEAVKEPQHELGRLEELRLKVAEAQRDFYSVVSHGYIDGEGNRVKAGPYIVSSVAIKKIKKWFGDEK